MNTTARIAAAVAAGYLLGRKRRLKLAITVGGLIAGQRVPTNPRDVSRELQKVIDGNEQLSQMSEQVRGNLTAVAKGAAAQVVTQRLERLSDSLGGGPSGDELAKDDESAENEGTRGTAAKKPAKKAPAKKTAKKAPAKTAKKAPAKKRSGTSGSRTRKRS